MSCRDVCLSHCKLCRIEYGRANFCHICAQPTEPGELFSPMIERETLEESADRLRACFMGIGRDIDRALGSPIHRLRARLKRG